MPVYTPSTPVVNTLTWPVAIRTQDVEFLVANLATLGATIEVGPSVTHPRNYNRLILPDGASYITRGSTHWTLEMDADSRDQAETYRDVRATFYGA